MATMDMRALLKGVLGDHLRDTPASARRQEFFPESAAVRPIFHIIRH